MLYNNIKFTKDFLTFVHNPQFYIYLTIGIFSALRQKY